MKRSNAAMPAALEYARRAGDPKEHVPISILSTPLNAQRG